MPYMTEMMWTIEICRVAVYLRSVCLQQSKLPDYKIYGKNVVFTKCHRSQKLLIKSKQKTCLVTLYLQIVASPKFAENGTVVFTLII